MDFKSWQKKTFNHSYVGKVKEKEKHTQMFDDRATLLNRSVPGVIQDVVKTAINPNEKGLIESV